MAHDKKELTSVKDLLWKNRVVLMWSKNPEQYEPLLIQFETDFIDRDIVWFIINETDITTNYGDHISEEFAVNTTNAFSQHNKDVLLIGKDGGVKNNNKKLDLEALLKQIDSMPMRINEMKYKD
ncbi:MAG: DUF4174 domain-containing protein [Marinicellaceae bacterium]